MNAVTTVTDTKYTIEFALDEMPEIWTAMSGFTFSTQDELDECYERYFRRMDGHGRTFRRVRIEHSIKVEEL